MLAAAPAALTSCRQPAQAQAADPAVAQVQGFYDALTARMKAGGTRQGALREAEARGGKGLRSAGHDRRRVGPAWATPADADKKALTDAFSRMTIANYAKNFNSYQRREIHRRAGRRSRAAAITSSRAR